MSDYVSSLIGRKGFAFDPDATFWRLRLEIGVGETWGAYRLSRQGRPRLV
jgi:hypothetical protein